MAMTNVGDGSAGLKANAMGLFGDWVAGIANVAPSSSVAFTLALMMSFAGLSSPFAVLIIGVGMLFVAVGYSRLNNWNPNAGSPFVWVGSVVRPWLGFAVGLLAIIGMLLFNIGNITLAGSYLISIIAPHAVPSSILVWVVSAAIMGLVLFLAIRGIRPSIRVQISLLIVEYAIVLFFVVMAVIYELSGRHARASSPSWHMFTPSLAIGGWRGITTAAVPIVVLYEGWEATLVLSEETTDTKKNPGRAAILGLVFLIVWYTLLTLVFQGIADPKTVIAHGSDVLAFVGKVLLPEPWARLFPLAVFIAVFGTTQMQLTASSRVVYAMAREKLLPRVLSSLSKHQTPLGAAILLGLIPVLVLIPYLISTGALTVIGDVISSAGIAYLFIYAVIALTSVWFYREALVKNVRFLIGSGLVPLIGGLMMVTALVYGVFTESAPVAWIGSMTIVVCLIVGIGYNLRSRHSYFHQTRVLYSANHMDTVANETSDRDD